MVKRLIHIFFLLGIICPGFAQQRVSIDLEAFGNMRLAAKSSGLDMGSNGGGAAIGIQKCMKNDYRVLFSGEFGAAGIGIYLAGKAGINKQMLINSSRLVYSPGLNMLQGIALFRPDPIYMWGVEQANFLDFKLNGKSGPGLLLAFRYYAFPGYAEYSSVFGFFDVRAGIRYSF